VIIPEAYHPIHPMGGSSFIAVDPPANNIDGLVYVHIPKNASCWAKWHLAQLQAKSYNYYHDKFDPEKNLALVILRDPVERWISAMGQILVGNRPDYPMHVDNLDWDQMTQAIVRNNHTQPQHEFFANIPHDRIVWFRCNNLLTKNITGFLKQYNLTIDLLSPDQDISNIFNVTKKVPERIINDYLTPPQQKIVDKIQMILDQHPKYIEQIKNLYQEDYKLFDSVPYYESR
jgi:hypothetical protein